MADILTREMIEDDMNVVDGLTTVVVRRVNPDTGATLQTANAVTCLRRVITKDTRGVGAEGEVPVVKARFNLKVKDIAFTLTKLDTIIDAMGTWIIDSFRTVTMSTRYECEATLKPT